jgi:cobalt-zinc-cadmium efflux system membrane fusion protein
VRRLRWALPLLLAACGGDKEAAHEGKDEHGHGHGEAGGHAEHDEAEAGEGPGVVRIARDMLRDLRITTAAAEARAAGERVTVLGELAVDQDLYAEIASPVSARVAKILVKAGDVVTAEQKMVELHSPELGTARAELAAAKTRAAAATAELERKRDLAGDNLVTKRELAEAEAAAKTAEAEVKVAAAALEVFGGGGGGTSRFALRTPVAGTVIERSVALGQLADPSKTLFRVADLSTLWLTAHVFERDAVRVRPGGTAAISLAALPGQTVEATVAQIGNEVDPSSRTISVRLDVPNPTGELRPGMSATVALPLGETGGAIVTVPLAAVQRVADHWVVFLPGSEEGVFDVRRIGRGRELGGEVEVLSGLAAGTRVVVDGAFLVKAEADKARGEGGGHDHH